MTGRRGYPHIALLHVEPRDYITLLALDYFF
jgi:hypothetical protein